MGTFAGYYGDMTIPEEKRDEFNQRMLYLLEQGGMMNFEQIQICGKEIALLTPLKPDKDNRVLFRYNWFEDDIWEPACYDINSNKLHTRKVGYSQFCAVICAAYVLYEFYARDFGIAERDGMVFDGNLYVGWLNYLFDERYTNARFEDPYRIFCLKPDTFQKQPLLPLIFAQDADCVSHVGFAKYIDAYLSKQRPEQERREILQEAENDDLKRPPYPPVEKVSTMDFLGSKGFSDDDRVYYWKKDGDVHLSPEMTEWMSQLRAELLEIKSDPGNFIKGQDLIRVLVELLDDADRTFGFLGMFQETFYYLLSHPRDPMRQAAVVLLHRLIARGKAELPPPNPGSRSAWREKRLSPARLRIKRYLGLLGNLELRKEVLGW